jgi:hypothetical protein
VMESRRCMGYGEGGTSEMGETNPGYLGRASHMEGTLEPGFE